MGHDSSACSRVQSECFDRHGECSVICVPKSIHVGFFCQEHDPFASGLLQPKVGVDIIRTLAEGVLSRNADDEIPLHFALRNDKDDDILLFLFEREPLVRSDLKDVKEKEKLGRLVGQFMDNLERSPPESLDKDVQHGFVKFVF